MKKKLIMLFSLSCFSASPLSTAYAGNPVSQDWVLKQIAASQRYLTATDWAAVCSSGAPTSASGCYGNVSSSAFTRVSDRLGGFTTYANINPINAPSSVFLKTFFGGTNIPADPSSLLVTLTNSAGRCGLFTQSGFGLGLPGVATNIPTSGISGGGAPNSASVASINNTTANSIYYNNQNDTLGNVTGPQNDPLYLVCVGYSPNDGSTAATLNVTAS